MKTRTLKRTITAAAFGIALLFAGAAYAQEEAQERPHKRHLPSPEKILNKFDRNQDGKLTGDELPERLAGKLMRADADGDGALTQDELKQAGEKMRQRHGGEGGPGQHGRPSPERLFQRFDKNQDGQLTQDELPERLGARLMKADADGDGAVTKEELVAGMKKAGKGGAEKFLSRFDKNQDGQLSQDELPERMAARLLKADTNGDGILTREELAAGLKKLHHKRGAGREPQEETNTPAE